VCLLFLFSLDIHEVFTLPESHQQIFTTFKKETFVFGFENDIEFLFCLVDEKKKEEKNQFSNIKTNPKAI
jgi:hypothetical protein